MSRLPNTLLVASFFTALLSLPTPAQAGKGEGETKRNMASKICAQIKCSEQQERELTQALKQVRVDNRGDKQALRDLRKQLASEWTQASPDEAKLDKLADQIAARQRNIADRRLEGMMEIHASLDPDQRKTVAAALMKRGGAKGKGKGKGKGKTKG